MQEVEGLMVARLNEAQRAAEAKAEQIRAELERLERNISSVRSQINDAAEAAVARVRRRVDDMICPAALDPAIQKVLEVQLAGTTSLFAIRSELKKAFEEKAVAEVRAFVDANFKVDPKPLPARRVLVPPTTP